LLAVLIIRQSLEVRSRNKSVGTYHGNKIGEISEHFNSLRIYNILNVDIKRIFRDLVLELKTLRDRMSGINTFQMKSIPKRSNKQFTFIIDSSKKQK